MRGNCHAGLVSASVVDDGVKDAIVTLEARSADRVHYFPHGSYRVLRTLQDDNANFYSHIPHTSRLFFRLSSVGRSPFSRLISPLNRDFCNEEAA